jgi:hypothetical protein
MTSNQSSRQQRIRWAAMVAVLVAASGAGLWSQRQALNRERAAREQMERELQALKSGATGSATNRESTAPAAENGGAPTGTAVATTAGGTGASAATAAPAAPQPPPKVLTQHGMLDAPRNDGLAFAGTSGEATGDGTLARLNFKATRTDAIGLLAVVVRLPIDSDGRILAFEPGPEATFGNITKRISDDGKFALYQGTAGELQSLEMRLSISGSAVADVRGTCGVGPMKVRIGNGSAKVE